MTFLSLVYFLKLCITICFKFEFYIFKIIFHSNVIIVQEVQKMATIHYLNMKAHACLYLSNIDEWSTKTKTNG